jgi:hypothetical protein
MRTPRPDRDSGSLRMVNLMRLLRDEGAHVVFLPADRAHAGAYTEALQQLGVRPGTRLSPEPAALDPRARPPLRHGRRLPAITSCASGCRCCASTRHRATLVFDTVDLHYLRERRGAELASDPALMRASERTRALELDMIARSDATLVVSDVERNLLAQDAPAARVDVLSNLHHIHGRGQDFAQRHDLVFVGGFRHPPNVDAVRWFVTEVFPLIRAQAPDIVFHCIGSDTTGRHRRAVDPAGRGRARPRARLRRTWTARASPLRRCATARA